MDESPTPSSSPLARFRAEVLVAVRRRGLVVDHDGGDRLLGWATGLDGPRSLADLVGPADLARVEAAMADATPRHPVTVDGPVAICRGDGGAEAMTVEAIDATDVADLDGWVLRLRPVTAAPSPPPAGGPIRATVANRFDSLAEAMAAGILVGDAVGRVDYANPAARELLWRTDHDLQGEGWLDAVTADDRGAVRAATERVRVGGTTEVVAFRVDVVGLTRWLSARFNAVVSDTGRPDGWIAILNDVTDDRATTDELARRATHDPLTGLPNRTLLDDRLGQAVARSVRSQRPLAVMFLDLDGFKEINDRHGHQVGDELLRGVADRLRTGLRAEDTAARLGGDEFVVIAEGVSPTDAREVALRLATMVGRPLTIGDVELTVRVSIGVAWSAPGTTDPARLVDQADQAMYEAKRSGRGLVFAPGT